MRVDIITVPYRYDDREAGLGAGPGAILAAGLIDRLRAEGVQLGEVSEAILDPALRERGRTAQNIGRLGAETARLVASARRRGDAALVLAGDDTAAIGVVAGLQLAHGAGASIGVVWLDAHGDFNTPETSYSGILAGMPVAVLAGLAGPGWREAARLAAPIPTDRLLLAGTRELDEKERELIGSTDVRLVPAGELRAGTRFPGVVTWLADRCDLLYLHIDLDVLDPRFVPSSSTPSADGLTLDELVSTLSTVLDSGRVAALTLTSVNPGAGDRGQRTVASALSVLSDAVPRWRSTPSAATAPSETAT